MKSEDKIKSLESAKTAISNMDAIYKRAGLTEYKLVIPIVEALQAENIDGSPDHRVRLKAVEIGVVLKGMKPPEKVEHSGNINLTHELATRMREARERAKSRK